MVHKPNSAQLLLTSDGALHLWSMEDARTMLSILLLTRRRSAAPSGRDSISSSCPATTDMSPLPAAVVRGEGSDVTPADVTLADTTSGATPPDRELSSCEPSRDVPSLTSPPPAYALSTSLPPPISPSSCAEKPLNLSGS